MPEEDVMARARRDAQEGKSPSTQAGEFVKEEIDHVREGKHGAASTKQAIAIGLSKARRAGIHVPQKGNSAGRSKRKSSQSKGRRGRSTESRSTRAKASRRALQRQPKNTASHSALSRQARTSARRRGAVNRRRSR